MEFAETLAREGQITAELLLVLRAVEERPHLTNGRSGGRPALIRCSSSQSFAVSRRVAQRPAIRRFSMR
jgi:hypothetical protein